MIHEGIEKEWGWLCEWVNDSINTIEPKSHQDPIRQRVFLIMSKIENKYLNHIPLDEEVDTETKES